MSADYSIERLLDIMVQLRKPETGCPWDIVQTFETIAPYTVEEAYEVSDAIERKDYLDLKDELGDLLFQVVYHARLAEEQNLFMFSDVIEAICTKMIRRHPHVFADMTIRDSAQINELWNAIKEQEKQKKQKDYQKTGSEPQPAADSGFLDDIPVTFPALIKADKLTKKAAKVGFDWDKTSLVLDKIKEELAEVEDALNLSSENQPDTNKKLEEEIGDLLFSVANLARHVGISPETALHKTNSKFKKRFHFIEKSLKERGKKLQDSNLEEMENYWNKAKEL